MIESGNIVYRMIANGEDLSTPLHIDHTLTSRLEGIWQTGARLSGDTEYNRIGSGQFEGKQTAIFEDEVAITFASPFTAAEQSDLGIADESAPAPNAIVYRNGRLIDQPLLFSSSMWEKDSEGNRTLDSERRIVEYRLLPADAQIWTFGDDS